MRGYKVNDFIKVLTKHNWKLTNRDNNHIILEKEGFNKHISIPNHKGKELCRPLCKRLLKEAGLLEYIS